MPRPDRTSIGIGLCALAAAGATVGTVLFPTQQWLAVPGIALAAIAVLLWQGLGTVRLRDALTRLMQDNAALRRQLDEHQCPQPPVRLRRSRPILRVKDGTK